jgi:hypothetical protein
MTGQLELINHGAVQVSRDQSAPAFRHAYWTEETLADDLVNDYIVWRESVRAVIDAYARWSAASGPERGPRFAATTCECSCGSQKRLRALPETQSAAARAQDP